MKKSPLGDYAYLAHIRDAIKTIKSYTQQGEGAFFKSQLLQDGVCRQLGIMGEAANKISAMYTPISLYPSRWFGRTPLSLFPK